jgi:hypothetical protein
MQKDEGMSKFIDAYFLPDVDPSTPYRLFVWESGSIAEMIQHRTIEEAAAWCKQQPFFVRVHDPQLREELRILGVDVRPPIDPPAERVVGDPGEE